MPHPNEPTEHRRRDDRSGWIYVLDNGMGHYKIGRTFHFGKRMKQLHIHLPFPVTVAYCFHDEDCVETEKALHEILAHRRLNGEWFALELDDFKEIYEMAGYNGYWESKSGEFLLDPFGVLPELSAVNDCWPDLHVTDEYEDFESEPYDAEAEMAQMEELYREYCETGEEEANYA